MASSELTLTYVDGLPMISTLFQSESINKEAEKEFVANSVPNAFLE